MTSETTPQASSGTAAPLPPAPAAKPANGKRKRALLVVAALDLAPPARSALARRLMFGHR